jgi:hypothetical protein
MDCIRTFEVAATLQTVIPQLGLQRQWEETLDRNNLALRMMNRGVLIDRKLRGDLTFQLSDKVSELHSWLEKIIPTEIVDEEIARQGRKPSKTPWYTSPDKQKILFGDILGLKVPRHRKTGRPTLGKDAIKILPEKHPEWRRLFSALEAARSAGVFRSHFLCAALDADGRMRCAYGPAGTESFRFNSAKNVFGRGTNLQNIPKGTED